METAKQVVNDAHKIVTNTKQYLNRNGDNLSQYVHSLVQNLKRSIKVTEQIISQTTAVQEDNFHLPNRIISIFDTDARPIRRGKIHAPTEFGYKVMLQETEEKVIIGYEVLDGNPNDDTLLADAIDKHIKTFGRPPRAVASDRGFGSAENERILKALNSAVCPAKGKLASPEKNTGPKADSRDFSAGVSVVRLLSVSLNASMVCAEADFVMLTEPKRGLVSGFLRTI